MGADYWINVWTDGGNSSQTRFALSNLTGGLKNQVPAHGIPNQPDTVEAIMVNELVDDRPIVSAQATVIERGGKMFGPTACTLIHADNVEPDPIGLCGDASHVARFAATFETMNQNRRGRRVVIPLPVAVPFQLRMRGDGEQPFFLWQSSQ